jgi:hypothetical protein
MPLPLAGEEAAKQQVRVLIELPSSALRAPSPKNWEKGKILLQAIILSFLNFKIIFLKYEGSLQASS